MRGGGPDRYAREAGSERSKYTLYTCVDLRTNFIFKEKKQLRKKYECSQKAFSSMEHGVPKLWDYTMLLIYNMLVEFLVLQLLVLSLLKIDLKPKQIAGT